MCEITKFVPIMKLFTEVNCEINIIIAHSDSVCVLGSCFADEMGVRLEAAGFDVLRNPFGTLYNPASLAAAVARLDSAEPFTQEDCVEMGAGAGRVGSFSHHTSFARPTAEEFLASFKFKAQTIQVNNKTASFDFTDFGM